MPKKNTSLTDYQRSRFKEWAEKWIKHGLSTERADWDQFEKGARECYRLANLNDKVPIVRVPSPIVGAFAAPIAANIICGLKKSHNNPKDSAVDSAVGSSVGSAVYSEVYSAVESAVGSGKGKLFWHYWLGGSFWQGWNAWVDFFFEVCDLDNDEAKRKFQAYKKTSISACYWWPNKHFIMVCDRPTEINLATNGRLHNTNGMAIKWPDGWGLYSLNGITVPGWVVMKPIHEITSNDIFGLKNVDQRREIIRRIGIDIFVSKCGAKVIDKRGDYELLSVKLSDEVPDARYLKMRNPSIHTWHVEGVEGNTVQEAIDFRKPKHWREQWEPGRIS